MPFTQYPRPLAHQPWSVWTPVTHVKNDPKVQDFGLNVISVCGEVPEFCKDQKTSCTLGSLLSQLLSKSSIR